MCNLQSNALDEGEEETLDEGMDEGENEEPLRILISLSQGDRSRRHLSSDMFATSDSESENFDVILDHTAEAEYEDTFGKSGDTLPATLPATLPPPTLPPATMSGTRRSTRRRVARSWSQSEFHFVENS